jgi:uncharacterized OB-fold protein
MTLVAPPIREEEVRRTDLSGPYWDACARGELVVQRCGRCGLATFPAAHVCPRCHVGELVWTPSRPTGAVYTYTTVWRGASPAFEVPYVIAWVDMDDGWQLMAPVVGCEPDDVAVGREVTVVFAPVAPGAALPVFELRAASNEGAP